MAKIKAGYLLHAESKKTKKKHREMKRGKRKINMCIKRSKVIEKPNDNSWITSGTLGSREAVLVFRTRILNANEKSSTITSSSSSTSSSTNVRLDNNCDEVTDHVQNDNNSNFKNVSSTRIKLIPSNSTTKNEEFLNNSQQNSTSISPFINVEAKIALDKKINATKMEEMDVKKKTNIVINKLNETLTITDVLNEMENDQQNQSETRINENNGSEDDDCYVSPYSNDMPATLMKITYKFVQTETRLLRKIFVRHGLTESETDDSFCILWTGIHLKPDILRNLAPYQRVNHFPRSYELTRKDHLYKNIERMQHLRGLRHFDFIPHSYVLPLEYKDLLSAHNKERGPWIVKPAASSRGRGIFIVSSPDQIPQDEQGLVSKYISNPLCIDGHKCDLRIYVLVTSFDPLIIYIYEEGLVRLATVKYDKNAENLWNPCMHLCNYSINKYHSDYIKSSDAHDEDVGHKWTLSALLRHLKSQGCDTNQLMSNIEDLVIKSILACAQSIIAACRMFAPNGNNCFELYGYDILIDDTLKPWLLEVNLSPSMGVDTPLDAKVKACLITDLLTCVGVPAYSPSMREYFDTKWTRFRSPSQNYRSNSADPTKITTIASRRLGNNGAALLTLDEQRIIRNSRLQNARRGGFVRIYPTEDTMARYGGFLDPGTGIPLSTPLLQGQATFSVAQQHNYNQMLYNNLYGKNSRDHGAKEENSHMERMNQYLRALETYCQITFDKNKVDTKCFEEGKRLRKQLIKLLDSGLELTQLQSRQLFSLYLESVLHRLTQEPRDYHEKLILKFLSRSGNSVKTPSYFRNPQNFKIVNKSRSAMVAKLLSDFLEQYNRDTDIYVDLVGDHLGSIPNNTFQNFLNNAEEADLESILAFYTNLTGAMPYLYNRFGASVPQTPPIPIGTHGFLKAMPGMVLPSIREFNKTERDLVAHKNDKPDIKRDTKTKTATNTKKGSLKKKK